MIASPRCGFVGLKPLTRIRPLSPSVPLNWSRVMADAASGADVAKRGAGGCRSDGPAESVQAVAQATSAPSATTLVMVPEICIDAIILLSENYMRRSARIVTVRGKVWAVLRIGRRWRISLCSGCAREELLRSLRSVYGLSATA